MAARHGPVGFATFVPYSRPLQCNFCCFGCFQVENPTLVTWTSTARNQGKWHGSGREDESWVPTLCWELTGTAVAVKILWAAPQRNTSHFHHPIPSYRMGAREEQLVARSSDLSDESLAQPLYVQQRAPGTRLNKQSQLVHSLFWDFAG